MKAEEADISQQHNKQKQEAGVRLHFAEAVLSLNVTMAYTPHLHDL
jgi:hypothetical protein